MTQDFDPAAVKRAAMKYRQLASDIQIRVEAIAGRLNECGGMAGNDNGANVNATDDDDCTPLHSAVAGDSAEVVRYLLDSGAYVDARNNKGETPLKLAVRNTTPAAAQIMAVLYAAGADPTIQADNGKSALDFVRRYGKPEERAVFNLD